MIFDWDDTLIENWAVIHLALNTTFEAMGVPTWSFEEMKSRVALSMRDTFPALFGARTAEAEALFFSTFAARHLDGLEAKPGAEAVLMRLRSMGVLLAVVSNKTGRFLRTEAAHLGWENFFFKIVGARDAGADKPDPAPVFLALEGSGLDPIEDDIWFIGDKPVDMRCAYASGCLPILIHPQSPDTEGFENHMPSWHFKDLAAFAAMLETLAG